MLVGTKPLRRKVGWFTAAVLTAVLISTTARPTVAQQPSSPQISTVPSQTVGAATREVADQFLAEKRVALVIGNGQYEHVTPLDNPTNDAEDISVSLDRLGFQVRNLTNLTMSEMQSALADFSDLAVDADIAVVFYAGHGIEVDRQNYLIPIDAQLKTDRRLFFEAMPLDHVMAALADVKGVRVVLLDACRDNPFRQSMRIATATRSIGRGLSRVEASRGTVISFAAKEGTIAEDGRGRNSPFTSALLANLAEPGVEIGLLFRKVRDSVLKATRGRQEPYVSASLPSERIFFVPPAPSTVAAPQPKPESQQTVSADNSARAAEAWSVIQSSDSRAVVESFIDEFHGTVYAVFARARLEELRAHKPGATKPQPSIPEREEASAHSAEPQEPPQAGPSQIEQTATDQPSDKQVAAVAPGGIEPAAIDPRELARSIQTELDRLGCEPGKPDGIWGRKSKAAVQRFNQHSSAKLAATDPSPEVLETLKRTNSRVCPLVCGVRFEERNGRCVKKTCGKDQTLNAKGNCVAFKPKSSEPPRNQTTLTAPTRQATTGGGCPASRPFQTSKGCQKCPTGCVWSYRTGGGGCVVGHSSSGAQKCPYLQ